MELDLSETVGENHAHNYVNLYPILKYVVNMFLRSEKMNNMKKVLK
jgi:hypothetical protein